MTSEYLVGIFKLCI